ncbi:MAG: DUF3558 family protein [Gordonia sp. (in: high G+C Gram-positive bacteria)]|uniref:DUF3558 family protein n=1 Tax=Gordonia sp. (in: high G+C Gram-positive bacteria) TaxID=84139 RepID=UPI0039E6950B
MKMSINGDCIPGSIIKLRGLRIGIVIILMALCSCDGDRHRGDVFSSRGNSEIRPRVIRQTDSNGRRLPFDTVHPNRWSEANGGSEYEPCTALSSVELAELEVDASSVRDAAGTDGQTLRGCVWKYSSSAVKGWTVSQIVGNSRGLDFDKRLKSVSADIWMPDIVIEGRIVGMHRLQGGFDCDSYVHSGRAAVNTIVMKSSSSSANPGEICARVLDFTRATIRRIPR